MRFSRASVLIISCATVIGAFVACSPAEEPADVGSSSELNDREDLFDKSAPLEMKLTVPVSTLFARYKAKQADPPEADAAPGEAQYSEAAKVFVADADGKGTSKTFDARIYIRGESSKFDCPFPKLKIEFSDKEALKGTLFKGHSKIRLNTHCGPGDENTKSGYGRIQNGVGPVREDLVYRLIRAADVPTYLTRVTKIAYEDPAANTTLDSFGLLIESGDDAAQRFVKAGLVEKDAEYIDANDRVLYGSTAAAENRAKLIVAEALAGNNDFTADGTHNVDSFGVRGAGAMKVFKIPQDFDLCAITTAGDRFRSGAVAAASPGLKEPSIAEHFASHRANVEKALDVAEQEYVAAKAMKSDDGKTTTDQGMKLARDRVRDLYALPELASDGGVAADAGHD